MELTFETVPVVAVDDGIGCVNAVISHENVMREITFYALTMHRKFQIMPGQKRPFTIMNFAFPSRMDDGYAVIEPADIMTVGDAVLYRTDSDAAPSTGNARYFDEGAKVRILSALARVLDPENFEGTEAKRRVRAYHIHNLGLGANVRAVRTFYDKLCGFMNGRHVCWINGTTYHFEIASTTVRSQPSAAELYLRSRSNFAFDTLSYVIYDIGTGTLDVLPFVRGVLDEDRATAINVAIEYLRQRLREILEPKFPDLEFQLRDLENLLLSHSPEILYNNAYHDVSVEVEKARTVTWKEVQRQLAPLLRNQQYDRAFFVGGGANVWAPTLKRLYAKAENSFEIVPHAHMCVAWGLFEAAKPSVLEMRIESGTKKRQRV